MKSFFIITIGCQMNKSDSERVCSFLEDNALIETKTRKEADLIVLVTCGVRQKAEDRVYGLINKIKKDNSKVKIVLTGCLSKRKDVIKRLEDRVDIFLPIENLANLSGLLNFSKRSKAYSKDYLKIRPKYNSFFSAFVPIGNGCNNFCSYCVVPYARGREVYRDIFDILDEIKYLIKNNYKELNLISQNVNSYQIELEKDLKINNFFYKRGSVLNFVDLVKIIDSLEGDFWVRFSSSHPKDMNQKLIEILPKLDKFCEHIHLPVQCGSDKILKLMNRKYSNRDYRILIEKIHDNYIKNNKKNLSITTDIIVGFPSEDKDDFEYTKKLFQDLKFDMAYIARYSVRPGTEASNMKDDLGMKEKADREEILMDILRKTSLKNNKKLIGKKLSVLIDGKNKKGEFFGKTRNNKLVKIKNDKNIDLFVGGFFEVKIIDCIDFGLMGESV